MTKRQNQVRLSLEVALIRLAVLLRRVVTSLGALTDEALSLLVSMGQPGGPCQVSSGCVTAHTTFKT